MKNVYGNYSLAELLYYILYVHARVHIIKFGHIKLISSVIDDELKILLSHSNGVLIGS